MMLLLLWNYHKAKTNFLPQLSASAGMTETLSATSAATSKSYSYGLSASQSIFNGGSNIFNLQSSYADYRYNLASYKNSQADVLYTVREAFISLLITQEKIKVLEKILEQRKENSQLIELRYQSGAEDKGNLLTTQADEGKSAYNLRSAKRSLRTAELHLAQLLDIPVGEISEGVVLAEIIPGDFDQLVKASPSFSMAKYRLESAEITNRSSITEFLPSVSLSGSYSKRDSSWPPDSESKSWGVNVSYPFFPGGRNIIEKAINTTNLARAEEDYAATYNSLRYDLEKAYLDHQDALDSLAVNEIYLEAHAERAKITRVKYLNGLVSYDEWDRYENSHFTAEKKQLDYKKTALLAEAKWFKLIGGYIK